MTPKFLAQVTGNDKINFGHTGLENPLRNQSGGVHRANGFMSREFRLEMRYGFGALRVRVVVGAGKGYKIMQRVSSEKRMSE